MGGIIRSYTMNDGDERPGRRFPRGRGKRGLSIAFSLLSALLFAPSLGYFTSVSFVHLPGVLHLLIYTLRSMKPHLCCLLLLNVISFNCHCRFPSVSYSSYCERGRKSQKVTDIYGVPWTMRSREPNKLSGSKRPFGPVDAIPVSPPPGPALLLPVTSFRPDLLTPASFSRDTLERVASMANLLGTALVVVLYHVF